MRDFSLRVCFLAAALAIASPLQAVIKIDLPVQRMYDASTAVLAGKVTKFDADSKLLVLGEVEAIKGAAPTGPVRVQLATPPDLIKQVSEGSPVVVLVARSVLVHVAGHWMIADAVGDGGATFRTTAEQPQNLRAFPGRTEALVAVLREMKAGKSTLLDKVDENVFRDPADATKLAPFRKLADLGVKGKSKWIASADFNGDGKGDLLVGAPDGPRLLLGDGKTWKDATDAWGLNLIHDEGVAVGDVNGDGKPDLRIDNELLINTGSRFTATQPGPSFPSRPVMTLAFADVNGDKRPDALLLFDTGEVYAEMHPGNLSREWDPNTTSRLWQAMNDPKKWPKFAAVGDFGDNGEPCAMVVSDNGIARYPLTVKGAPAADHLGLTGESLGAIHKENADGWKVRAAMVIDANGDGRPDLLIATQNGADELLINRGFGAFFAVGLPKGIFADDEGRKSPVAADAPVVWCAARLHADASEDVVLLDGEGGLWVLESHARK